MTGNLAFYAGVQSQFNTLMANANNIVVQGAFYYITDTNHLYIATGSTVAGLKEIGRSGVQIFSGTEAPSTGEIGDIGYLSGSQTLIVCIGTKNNEPVWVSLNSGTGATYTFNAVALSNDSDEATAKIALTSNAGGEQNVKLKGTGTITVGYQNGVITINGTETDISNLVSNDSLATTLSNYYTKTEIDGFINQSIKFKGVATVVELDAKTLNAENVGDAYKISASAPQGTTLNHASLQSAEVGDLAIVVETKNIEIPYSWALVPADDNIDVVREIQVNGAQFLTNDSTNRAINFVAGTGVTLISGSEENGAKTLQINATTTTALAWQTITQQNP